MLFTSIALLSAIGPAQTQTATIAHPSATDPTLQPTGFGFGSYGRVSAGTDANGSSPRSTNVTRNGPRIVEDAYVELDLYYGIRSSPAVYTRIVITPALQAPLFHSTGEFDAELAIRNLYAMVTLDRKYDFWAGSRMYRGDDIYLLNFWPLDDLNMVGGGVGYHDARFRAALAVGTSRLLDLFQFQEVDVAGRLTGEERIVRLDRQRFIASLKGTYHVLDGKDGLGLKTKLNFEFHGLPSGERERVDGSLEQLPGDIGLSVGAQIGLWGFLERATHLNIFARFGVGLAAFDELETPFGFNRDKQVFSGASELLLGLSGALEVDRASIATGAYLRRFQDADGSDTARDDWEAVVDLRPSYALTDLFQFAVDLSYEHRLPRGPSPQALEVLNPRVIAVAPMLLLSPNGPGSFTRPHLRLVYRYANLNDGARDTYAVEDPRSGESNVHYVGLQAEWWFNSNYRR